MDLDAAAGQQSALIHRMLGRLNICSKEYLIRQYDHEVKGGSVVKPLIGVKRDGPADAAVLRRPGRPDEHLHTATVSPMAAEADATIAALRSGRTEVPEMPWTDTRATAALLAQWRAALG